MSLLLCQLPANDCLKCKQRMISFCLTNMSVYN